MDVPWSWVMSSMSYGKDRYCLGQDVDGMVQKLKDVRYVPQLKRNIIFVGALKALGLEVSIKDGVRKMVKGSMVILKGV